MVTSHDHWTSQQNEPKDKPIGTCEQHRLMQERDVEKLPKQTVDIDALFCEPPKRLSAWLMPSVSCIAQGLSIRSGLFFVPTTQERYKAYLQLSSAPLTPL